MKKVTRDFAEWMSRVRKIYGEEGARYERLYAKGYFSLSEFISVMQKLEAQAISEQIREDMQDA